MPNFCKFSINPFKPKIIWELTNQCNYRCHYCIFASSSFKPNKELTLDEIKNVLIQLKLSGFKHIKYTGGEPFLRQDILDILKETNQLGLTYDISTNASLITKEMALTLKELNPEFVHVSLDGATKEEHESVRGPKSWEKTIRGLKLLTETYNSVRVGCVIHKQNRDTLEKFCNFLVEKNVHKLIFSMMEPAGKMTGTDSRLTPLTSELAAQLNELKVKFPTLNISNNIEGDNDINAINLCPAGSNFLFVNSTGDVSPCPWLSDKQPKFNTLNLRNNELTEILNSSLFRNFELSKEAGSCPASKPVKNLVTKFEKIYPFATENLVNAFEHLPPYSGGDAFCLTASGDQIIEIIKLGYRTIHCIDINYLAKYWVDFKLTALKLLTYEEFIQFLFSEQPLDYRVFKKLRDELSFEASRFWHTQYQIYNYSGLQLSTSYLFQENAFNKKEHLNFCNYLKSKVDYLQLQHILRKETVSICFKTGNLINNTSEIPDNLALIYLSNLADYSHKLWSTDYIESFKLKVIDPLYTKLNKKGAFVVAYLYDYSNLNNSDLRNKFNKEKERVGLFTTYDYKEHIFSSYHAHSNVYLKDAICLIKK